MENLQMQSATMKKINTPSDDPVAAAKLLEVRTDKVLNEQLGANAKLAMTYLSNSEQALGELGDIALRAKEIAIGQASAVSSSPDTRQGVAEEITQLFQQAVAIGNRRIGDRYIFGGFRTDKPPIDRDGRYHGDNGQQMVEIGKDVYVTMNLPGIEAFNSNPKNSTDLRGGYSRELGGLKNVEAQSNEDDLDSLSPDGYGRSQQENANIFDELQTLRISLLTGDITGIQNTLERFDQLHGRLTAMRAKLGSRIQGIESASQANERHNLINAQLSSHLEDADMAQVVSDLAKEETVFRSSLQSSQKLIQPTLLDFLK